MAKRKTQRKPLSRRASRRAFKRGAKIRRLNRVISKRGGYRL